MKPAHRPLPLLIQVEHRRSNKKKIKNRGKLCANLCSDELFSLLNSYHTYMFYNQSGDMFICTTCISEFDVVTPGAKINVCHQR